MSRSELYGAYQESLRALEASEQEKHAMHETLERLLAELDAKAPRILEQRRQLESLSQAHESGAVRLAEATREAELLGARAEALQAELDQKEEATRALDTEVGDLTRQLQLVLAESQRRAAKDGAPGVGSLGGIIASAASAAGRAFGVRRPGDEPTPESVIDEHLVDFSDVAELQQQNAKLLRTVRRLGEAHEKELREREASKDEALALAMGELDELREASLAQRRAVEQLEQQRELYRDQLMLVDGDEAGGNAGGDAGGGASAAEAAALADALAAARRDLDELQAKSHTAQSRTP